MKFNAIINNMSVISWRSVLLAEEQLPMQSVPITTKVVNSNAAQEEVYTLQHYVKKYVSDLRQVGVFLRLLRFPPPIKLTATI
jgi:carbonic anhydrase/acetyltransferase-like protein (isoleucine patch superfamily)